VPPSSSGLGHRPFKPAARIRIPLGAPLFSSAGHRDSSSSPVTGTRRGALPPCGAPAASGTSVRDGSAGNMAGSRSSPSLEKNQDWIAGCRATSSRTTRRQTEAGRADGGGTTSSRGASPQEVAPRSRACTIEARCARCESWFDSSPIPGGSHAPDSQIDACAVRGRSRSSTFFVRQCGALTIERSRHYACRRPWGRGWSLILRETMPGTGARETFPSQG
jgi:hypothetical protein